MSGIKDYSTIAGSNNAAPPNGAPEGMAPSYVNDVIRQVMADIRTQFEAGMWFDHGITPAWVSSASFSLSTDLTTVFTAGRPVEIYGATMGTAYSQVKSSTYVSPLTTVTLNHSSIGSTISQVRYSLFQDSNALPRGMANDYSISGALSVSGAASIGGDASVSGALAVGGIATLGSISTGGNASISGSLAVKGPSTFSASAAFSIFPAMPVSAVRAYTTTSKTIPTGVETDISFDIDGGSLAYDLLGEYATATGQFTASLPGYYRFSAMVKWDPKSGGDRYIAALQYNGAGWDRIGRGYAVNVTSTSGPSCVVTGATYLAGSSNILKFAVFQDSGSTATAADSSVADSVMCIERFK